MTRPARWRPALLVAALAALLAVLCLLSIGLGALSIPPGDVIKALTGQPTGPRIEDVIWSVRIPRTALGLAAGAALGLSGCVMQALTRNPLADPGILGVSAGAAFAIVIAAGVAGIGSLFGYIWFAFAGAMAASVVVYLLGRMGRSGSTPVKLALAGVAVTAVLSSLTSAVVLTDPAALDRFRFWSAGSLADQDASTVLRILPFLGLGALLALASAPALNSLALGDDVAASLGRKLGLVRLRGVVAVTLLTGAAVAVIGPVVFIGLVVPHVARVLAQYAGLGPDHRWLLPLSAALAAGLLLGADILGRVIARPVEVQAGIIVAFIGGPFFIALVRRRRLAEI
ncbi:iron chelate uptake ABC transporter family permease subunit [Streptomyces sp. MBT56]|uniref:FecCD family ABC transporter permease n=1 Tax=unclassified Streptomyces TaxID=2593676 RepID=UPI00190DAD62|nr:MULTISPECIES: iron chelate uptake ABC transporter family permease subunit [unclassified Streptomyces]MBK3556129.1 iron chelate uptake ABC transporter family permease subunit [Streptomyces sp. MBT56]MBK3603457.1 iron chelate uptake ABC transporter family permease subunit [Streptomyces sp. MBT54]MBK3616843.1 iron chelate uptake ABC transporter family permease subunit [Streptomyces sp. MBT98]MBK6043638.1 iron chelate uptake ABC transporter family permease subunit [Streptomyces sp. MBT55]